MSRQKVRSHTWALLFSLSFVACEIEQAPDSTITFQTNDSASTTTLIGTIRIRTLDGALRSRTQYAIITNDGKWTVLLFEQPPSVNTGDRVIVAGTWIGEHRFAVTSLQLVIPKPYRMDTSLKRAPIHHKVAILAMQEASISEEDVLGVFNTDIDSVKHFFGETTFGWDTFSGDIFRRYEISYSEENCLWDNAYDISDKLIAAFEEEGNDAAAFDHIAVIVPRSCGSDWSGAWADVGSIGNTGELSFELISMFKDDCIDPWFFTHELGHNLGMTHSRSVDCGNDVYRTSEQGCLVEEYGNYNDVMGSGEGVYYGAAYQRYLGWTDPASVVTANRNGDFNLHPSDSRMCGIHALRVPVVGEEGAYFYLEYRHARDDSRYAGIGRFGGTRRDAVILTVSRDGAGGSASSNVDRVETGTSQYEGLKIGVRYDLGAGIAVTVVSIEGAVARVTVEMLGNTEHQSDDGSAVFLNADGSIGQRSCVEDEPDTGDNTDDDSEGDTDSEQETDSQTAPSDDKDTTIDTDFGLDNDPTDVEDEGTPTSGAGSSFAADSEGAPIFGGDPVSSDGVDTDSGSRGSAKADSPGGSSCNALAPLGRAGPLSILNLVKSLSF